LGEVQLKTIIHYMLCHSSKLVLMLIQIMLSFDDI